MRVCGQLAGQTQFLASRDVRGQYGGGKKIKKKRDAAARSGGRAALALSVENLNEKRLEGKKRESRRDGGVTEIMKYVYI